MTSETKEFFNIDAERALLGSILLNNDVFEEISDIVFPEIFYLDIHKKIYQVIDNLLKSSQIADIITVSNFSSYTEDYKDITSEYLLQLTNSLIGVFGYKTYASLLKDLFLKREILILNENIHSSLSTNKSAETILMEAEENIFHLSDNDENNIHKKSLGDTSFDYIEKIRSIMSNKSDVNGLSSGLKDLDKLLGGFQDSDLIILAGRPSMGKTALATNIAYNVAKNHQSDNPQQKGAPVLIFSLEMSAEQLSARILATELQVSSDKLRRGQITEVQFNQLATLAKDFANIPLYIEDKPALTTAQIRTYCRKFKRKHNIGFVIIDYLQLINTSSKTNNRVNEISEITRDLKSIAKEINIPIIALSQLSRAVETREDKRPLLSDLRESGSIEQDADIVSFIYREEYYLSRKSDESRSDAEKQKLATHKNIAECIIAKNRQGAIGTVELFFNSELTLFGDIKKT